MMIDLTGINQIRMNIIIQCPSCGQPMLYVSGGMYMEHHIIRCQNPDCSENGKTWVINFGSGLARRAGSGYDVD